MLCVQVRILNLYSAINLKPSYVRIRAHFYHNQMSMQIEFSNNYVKTFVIVLEYVFSCCSDGCSCSSARCTSRKPSCGRK